MEVPVEYRRVQIGWPTLIPVVLAAAIPLIIFNAPGADKAPLAGIMAVAVPVLLLAVASLFGWLTVTVDREALRAAFGVGLVRRTIPLTEIQSLAATTIGWQAGWGLRLTPKGWLYRASGTRAVDVGLRSGKHVFVGSDDPEALIQALRMNGVA